jgi:L-ascorbate metabolism protein UlaG (beta-lactamase superfamily)
LRIYHSGDCVPYPGLADELRRMAVDVAILPVNGRDAQPSAAGIPGNFTFDEAVALCRQAGINAMVACHFGMFDFNTVEETWLDGQIATMDNGPRCVRPRLSQTYELSPPAEASQSPQHRHPRETIS